MPALLAFLFLLFLASPSWAAITFDQACTFQGTSSISGDCSNSVAADANIAIVCLAVRDHGGAVQANTAVSVEGAAATNIAGASVTTSNSVIRVEMWRLLAPTTGANITLSVTGHASTDLLVAGLMTFKGVSQSSPFNGTGTTASATTGTNADVNSIASAVGELGVYCGSFRSDSVQAGAADGTAPVSTERFDLRHSGNALTGVGYTEDGAVTSINMRVDMAESHEWAASAISMMPAADATRRAVAPILFQ
jgi:hypothetical protein